MDPSPEPDLPPAPEPLAGEVFDSHCHLNAMAHRAGLAARDQPAGPAFVASVAAQAAAVGISRLINVGCELGEWQSALDATAHPAVYAALAVHPRVVAVGETGLDYYWKRTTPAEQQEHFRRHIELAKRVAKPLVVHDRDAHADVLRVLAEAGPPPAGVIFHSFSGDAEMAAECVRRGYLLSFSGVLTFKNAPALRAAAELTPLDRILVETDAPFLTPHPFRGRPNAPYLVPYTVRALAQLKNRPEFVVCDTISATGAQVFGV